MPLDYIYIPNIPQGAQQINNTQSPINGNFQNISNLISVNHVPFNTPDDFGKHAVIDYVSQQVDPNSSSNDMVLFSKFSSSTNKIELFARYPNNGAVIQITGISSSDSYYAAGGRYSAGINPDGYQYGEGFWQYFPGGGFMLFGTISTSYTGVGNGEIITAKYPIAENIPQFSQTPFNIQLFPGDDILYNSGSSKGFYAVLSVSTTYFNIYNNPNSAGYSANWMAIGV